MSSINNPNLNNCTGSGCSGGQCSGGGCNGGSCGGSGCKNNPSSTVECENKIILDDSGYTGGQGLDLTRKRLDQALKDYYEYKCNRQVIDEVHYIDTKEPCDGSIKIRYSGDSVYRCINGTWHYADGGRIQDKNQIYETKKDQEPLYLQVGGGLNPCKEEPIYDHHGCIIGYKPFLVAEGEFGIWQTSEIYPMTKNCGDNKDGDCEYIYGDLAGKNVRLFRTPSVSKEHFYIGGRDGVPSRYDGGGMEDDGAYVFMLGLKVEGITPPENLPKPLCSQNPYSITYVERTESNKSVIGSGLLINTFLGDVSGELHAVPKIGLNSPEHYDVHINKNNTFFRGGDGDVPTPSYVFHSPDLHLRRPQLDAYRIIIEGEEHGEGYRYGLYDRGTPPENFYLDRKQQKGTRQAINLSRFVGYGEPVVRCVKAMSYVRANSKLANDDKFTYPLLNTYKESCSYIELNPGSGKTELINQGSENPQPSGSQSFADESFVGDTKNSERILKGAALYATVTRYIPNQYGSPILQTYIPLGLEIGSTNGVPNSTGQGLCGDSFVNGYSIKRTSYVSDKVPPFIVSSPISPDSTSLQRFSGLVRFLYQILGIKGWAELPVSGNEGDFTNRLHLNNRNGGATNPHGTDIYYPSLVKTNIWAYFNSDCNLHFRQTGSPTIGEVNIHRLKGLNRDSAYPFGSKWQDGFLNRFDIPWDRVSGFKQLLYVIVLFCWVYVIGGTIIVNGLNDGSQIVAGIGSTSVMAWIFFILEIVVGIAWIIIWATTSQDNRMIASFLGIDLQYPDIDWQGARAQGAAKHAMREGRARGFEDNYHKINHDYSLPNQPEKGFGMSDPYVTCVCPCEKTSKIVYSNKQLQGSYIDSYANFKTNNFLEIDAGLGHITKIFELNGILWAHTTDHLVQISSSRGSADREPLGSGSLLRGSTAIMGGIQEGIGGLRDPNAAIVTEWGYIFPDREARDWYIFTGGGKPISLGDMGMRQFFNQNMPFEINKNVPEFDLIDKKIDGGVGYSIGVDHENGYLFLTKVDYQTDGKDSKSPSTNGCLISNPLEPKCNKSWTLTFDIKQRQWVGFEYFTPFIYAWNRYDIYSFNKNEMWRHNSIGKFQTYYGKFYPTMIEAVAIDRSILDDFDYQGTIIDTEAYQWRQTDYIRSSKVTFDKLVAYNSHQNTGEVSLLNNNDNLTPSERSRGFLGVVNLEFKGRRWQFKRIIDRLRDPDEFQFEYMCEVQPKKIYKANIGEEESNYSFNDNHLAYRFYFTKHDDIKLFLKGIVTTIDAEIDVTQ